MDANLIIDDDYVDEVGRLCKSRGEALDKILVEYIDILAEIEEGAIVTGDVAKALTAYKGCVVLLKEQLTTISTNCNTLCDSFISEINEADDYLF